jgi:hypothetical protein
MSITASIARFREHCACRAKQVAAGKLALQRATDLLQADAEGSGLVEAVGQDAVQQTMAEIFQETQT